MDCLPTNRDVSTFFKLVRQNKLAELSELIIDCPHLRHQPLKDINDRTPLFIGCIDSNYEIVDFLLREFPGAVSVRTNEGYLPLHVAAQRGDLSLFARIFTLFPEACSMVAENGRTALHFACQCGHLDIADYCLQRFPLCARIVAVDGRLPLHLAAFSGVPDLVQTVLAHFPDGARVKTNEGYFPVLIAADSGHVAAVRLLQDAYPEGAYEVDTAGRTPLHMAVLSGREEVAHYLLSASPSSALVVSPVSGRSVIHTAAVVGSALSLQERLLHCCGPDSVQLARLPDGEGYLPLHMAAQYGALDASDLLLAAYPEAAALPSTNTGRTALHFAAQVGSLSVARRLLKLAPGTAQMAATDETEVLPAHLAAFGGFAEVLRLLVARYPDGCSQRGNGGGTVLHSLAKGFIHREQVLFSAEESDLLRLVASLHPAAVDSADDTGQTPYICLSEYNQKQEQQTAGESAALVPVNCCHRGDLRGALRIMLRFRPHTDLQTYHALNWAARREAFLVTAAACPGGFAEFVSLLRPRRRRAVGDITSVESEVSGTGFSDTSGRSGDSVELGSGGDDSALVAVPTSLLGAVFHSSADVWRHAILFL